MCAQDYQLCSKDDDVDNEPEENEKSTDDDEDSTFCDSTFDDNSTADEATSSRSDKESDLAYIVLCENFVMELSSHSMYEDCIAFFKNGSTTEHLIEEFHQNFLFKVQFGFDEDWDFFEDLSDDDYEDLYLYTNFYPRRRSNRRNQSSPQALEISVNPVN